MGFLEGIVRKVRSDIEQPDYDREVPAERGPPPKSLREALGERNGRPSVIAEFKRVSPGSTEPRLPRHSFDGFLRSTDVPEVVGLSCLATRPEFEGAPADVAELARRSPRPVLFKDFTIGQRQLDVARRASASAVLLIARLDGLKGTELSTEELADGAHARGLEVLLELHSEAELSLADRVPADVYGVNVRDLDTLKIDWATAERTLHAAGDAGHRPLVGLSGIGSREDADRFWSAGADAVLVGTSLARSSDPGRFVRSLLPEEEESHR